MFTTRKLFAGTAIAAISVFGVAACSDDDSSGGSSTSPATSAQTAGPTSEQPAPTPVAVVPALTGRTTAVALDKGFTDALTSLMLTPGTVGSATMEGGSVVFPITGGNVTYYTPGSIQPYVQGIINHEGSGLSLTAGNTVVELTNFNIDPGTSKLMGDVTVDGTVAAPQAILFDLDGSTLQPLQSNPDGTAVLTGTTVKMSADAAGLLNKTFNTDAVKAGLVVGVATITINTQ